MTTRMTATYECKKCGTEITVNGAGLTSIDPIYCCGLPIFKTKRMTGNTDKKITNRALPAKKSVARTSKKGVPRASTKK